MKQKIKRLTALVCAVAMMAALCLALRPVDTAYGASLNDQLAETRAKKQEIQQQLDQIKSDKAKALEQKELLDQQAAVIAQQIDLLELQIKDTQDRITENEAQEEQQYQLFCRQVRQEEERGAVSYWSVLFKATGFADLLSRMDFINEIVEHDQSVIDQLRTLREQLAQDKADLEQQQAELTASKTLLYVQGGGYEAMCFPAGTDLRAWHGEVLWGRYHPSGSGAEAYPPCQGDRRSSSGRVRHWRACCRRVP